MYNRNKQSYVCAEAVESFEKGHLYISYDVLNPTSFAHLMPFIEGKSIGLDSSKWEKYHPSALMVERALRKCEHYDINLHIFNVSIYREDLEPILKKYFNVLNCFEGPLADKYSLS